MSDATAGRALPGVGRLRATARSSDHFEALGFELVALAALLVTTAAVGRTFSKVELGFSWLHPTEVVLAAALLIAILRAGPRTAWRRLAATGVAVPLGILWLFGALSAARGLATWGFSMTIEDIGLVEYSLLIPIVAVVVVNRAQLVWLASAVALGGLVAIAVQALALWTPLQWNIAGDLELIDVATGMYISLYVAWVGSRLAVGLRVARWHYPLAVLGVGLVVMGLARAAWLALLAAFFVIIVLAAPGRRLLVTGAVAAAVLLGVAFSIPAEKVQFGEPPALGNTPGDVGVTQTAGSSGPSAAHEITASFDPSDAGGQNVNSAWRLAYWSWVVEQTVKQPIDGAGFGAPANFTWSDVLYDARTGDPADPHDVTPPHNSFVNVLYRMGFPGLIALACLILIALRRLVPVALQARGENRALAIWLLAALTITSCVASFSVALEGPFMGIFFWTALGLTLVAPQFLSRPAAERTAA
jgi:hypothetical protein